MASSAYVEAQWVGPPNHQLPNGTVLETGKTTVILTRGEAEESDNWKVKGSAKAEDQFASTGVDLTEPEPVEEPEHDDTAASPAGGNE